MSEFKFDGNDFSMKELVRLKKVGKKKKRKKSARQRFGKDEASVQEKLVAWLRRQYPDVMYSADASGVKFTMGQAQKLKRQGAINRAHPDLTIYEMRKDGDRIYGALFLELKAEDVQIYKQDGTLRKSEHTQEQDEYHVRLRAKGYRADFATGFEEARLMIEEYLAMEAIG